jgi:hypothetical protein
MRAIRTAWWSWFAMLTLPFVLFLALLFTLQEDNGPPANRGLGGTWFIINMAYLAVGIPLAFWFRSRMFERYYHGQSVEPRKYLLGMQVLWAVLVIGGILSLVGCWVARTLTPNIIPALVAFVFFITQWPKGHAMLRPRGDRDDSETYEEPR